MNQPVSLGEVGERLSVLENEHNQVLVRLTALQVVVNALCWGVGRERKDVADRILLAGANSLAEINTIGGKAPQEVVNVWNAAVNQLINPNAEPGSIGDPSKQR